MPCVAWWRRSTRASRSPSRPGTSSSGTSVATRWSSRTGSTTPPSWPRSAPAGQRRARGAAATGRGSPSSVGSTSPARDCRCCSPPCRPSGRRSATSRSAWPATEPHPRRAAALKGCRVLGGIDEPTKRDLLARTDVFVAPQVARESFGIVVLEALAAGAEVVASDLPAFVDLLRPAGRPPAGWAVPAGRCGRPRRRRHRRAARRRTPAAPRRAVARSGTTGRGSPRPSPRCTERSPPAPRGRRSPTGSTGSGVPGPRWTTP